MRPTITAADIVDIVSTMYLSGKIHHTAISDWMNSDDNKRWVLSSTNNWPGAVALKMKWMMLNDTFNS